MLNITTRSRKQQQEQQQLEQQQKQRRQQQQQQLQQANPRAEDNMARKNIDFSLCPKFDPKLTDPETWLDKWDLFHEINKTSEDNKIKYVGLIFDGPQRDWFSKLAADQKDTWDHFKPHLKPDSYYVESDNNWSKVGQIFHTKQKPNQDVGEYITNMQKMSAEVDLPETQTIQALLKGINSKLRPDVQKSNPATVKDFITAATQAQSIYTDSEESQNPSVEAFISVIEPYFEKQMTALSETLEKKIALSVASVSKPQFNKRNYSNQPHSYNAHFQPRHHQFKTRPTLPNHNQQFNNSRTVHTNSWQQTRGQIAATLQQYRPTYHTALHKRIVLVAVATA